jgi:hypothetical protein
VVKQREGNKLAILFSHELVLAASAAKEATKASKSQSRLLRRAKIVA